VPALRTGPVTGLGGQALLLAALAGTVGLDPLGLLAGLGYGVVLCVLLTRALHGSRLGPADRVTLTRATLAGGVTALVVADGSRPVLVALTAVALVLDAVDGRVARGTGTVSRFGARFDMEVDAFLILVLSAYAARSVGGWVLAIGALRYGYLAAGRVLPWLPGPLPVRHWRKVVAAAQGVALVVVAAGVLPPGAATATAVLALALLVESFGRDVRWRWRHRATVFVPAPRSVGEDGRGPVRGGAVRRGGHVDPALRERGDAAA
jgi:phosphatidylglycerophosphate synthase